LKEIESNKQSSKLPKENTKKGVISEKIEWDSIDSYKVIEK